MARDYGRIYTNFWNSPDIRPLSDQGKLLAAYLLTSPHSNIVGAYLLPASYIADDIGWPVEKVLATLDELFVRQFCQRFADGRHIVVCAYLVWNPVENGNILKAALKQADALPDDPALSHIIKHLEPFAKRFGKGFETLWQTLSKRLPKPFRTMDMEMEMEQEMESQPRETLSPPASTVPVVGNTPIPPSGVSPTSEPLSAPPPPAKAASVDNSTWVFNEGLMWLATAARRRPDAIRSLIGKWRKAMHNDDAKLRGLFDVAAQQNPIDPVSWMEQAVATRAKQNGNGPPLPEPGDEAYALDEDDERLARHFGGIATDVMLFKRGKGKWPADRHGPAPDQAGNKVDPVVLSKHGYAPPDLFQAWRAKF